MSLYTMTVPFRIFIHRSIPYSSPVIRDPQPRNASTGCYNWTCILQLAIQINHVDDGQYPHWYCSYVAWFDHHKLWKYIIVWTHSWYLFQRLLDTAFCACGYICVGSVQDLVAFPPQQPHTISLRVAHFQMPVAAFLPSCSMSKYPYNTKDPRVT